MSKSQNPLIWPNVDGIMADALQTLQIEVAKLKSKSSQGRSLDSREAKILQGYIKSLVDLSKEDRERSREQDLSDISDEELLKLLGKKAPKQLGAGSSDAD